MKIRIFALVLVLLSAICVTGQQSGIARKVEGETDKFGRLERQIPRLMEQANVPGLSVAAIREGKLEWVRSFGVKNSKTREPVTNDTVFEAASLTKPIVAYALFKLADEGKIDLDVPLNRYLGNNYDAGEDLRINLITARHVLSHTSGFPNWRRRGSKTLPINFNPGEKFRYSGEGFVYLSKVIEKITGQEFGKYVKDNVLRPLGMTQSSIDWETEFLQSKVFNHDLLGQPRGQNARIGVNAASSLHTTAREYALFMIAVMKGTGLSKASRQSMLRPAVEINKKEPKLRWGLGWGLQITGEGKSFWHWGDNGFNKSFAVAFEKSGDGVVFFTNSANGLSFLNEMVQEGVGGEHPSISWIDYDRFDSPSRVLSNSVIKKGAREAVSEYLSRRKKDNHKIKEWKMNRLGYNLMRIKRFEDAIVIFRQNTLDYPKSANTWDSLGEAYLKKGDNVQAIKYYRKSLELNPSNKNAEEIIKKITNSKTGSSQ